MKVRKLLSLYLKNRHENRERCSFSQKQAPRGVLGKRCSKKITVNQTFQRTSKLFMNYYKMNFTKVILIKGKSKLEVQL